MKQKNVECLAPIPNYTDGWSVLYYRDYGAEALSVFQVAQGLHRDEAVEVARMVFHRDPTSMTEILDRTGTARGSFRPQRPDGFLEF